MKNIRIITWKDVERVLFSKKNLWKSQGIIGIEASPIELVVYMNSLDEDSLKCASKLLHDNLGQSYIEDRRVISPLVGENINVSFVREEMENLYTDVYSYRRTPLFKFTIYEDSAYDKEILKKELPGVPVIAFHSYKGGVGRTLSLLAYAKAWTQTHEDNQRLLIVDADIEAPGITWLMEEEGRLSSSAVSYLDLMDLINDNEDVGKIRDAIVDSLKTSTMKIETSNKQVEHYIMPDYRYNEQVFDLNVKPENVVYGMGKEYIIADELSMIGEKLGVGAVLIDLRAGISEFSAPILLDPRVDRYIVTTTSDQSVMGTSILLKQINKGLVLSENSKNPKVLITMVQENQDRSGIRDRIVNQYQFDENEQIDDDVASLADGIITELPYNSDLIHLGNWTDIIKKLSDKEFYKRIEEIVGEKYISDTDQSIGLQNSNRENVILKLNRFTSQQITAEGDSDLAVLTTEPINNLVRDYRDNAPTVVIMGAKGSGKTFLFREMIKQGSWNDFLNSVEPEIEHMGEKSYFLPLILSQNASKFDNYVKKCKRIIEEKLNIGISLDELKLSNMIRNEAKVENDDLSIRTFWEKLFISVLDYDFGDFRKLDGYLKNKNAKIIFVIDGMEEILTDVHTNHYSQQLIKMLVQAFVDYIRLNYSNLGCVFFMREDMIRDAIPVNFEQFYSVYKNYTLHWSQKEALRLAAWVCNKVDGEMFGFSKGVTGSDASEQEIDKLLKLLWGKKLGKDSSNEAYSSRWILAALSDFNGQLQARDMIRFLQYATEEVGKKAYEDRLIMPTEIRKAVPKCSQVKIDEFKQERPMIKEIFEKMDRVDEEKKVLPLVRGNFGLNQDEEEMLRKEGYLKESNNQLYLPEIIRHALGYRYSKGARPKVLSLLIK